MREVLAKASMPSSPAVPSLQQRHGSINISVCSVHRRACCAVLSTWTPPRCPSSVLAVQRRHLFELAGNSYLLRCKIHPRGKRASVSAPISLCVVQGMAGNIIHAIATTNAIISGLIAVQALKILAGCSTLCKVYPCALYPPHSCCTAPSCEGAAACVCAAILVFRAFW